jgi:putative heme-binding domain-containing protein
MPAFSLPEDQLTLLADYVRSLNATAFEAKPPGDVTACERFFFGAGNCASCHSVGGRGGSNGPDLSNVAQLLTLSELQQSLTDPSARIAPGYAIVDVTLKNGQSLRGFARSRGSHDLQLETPDGVMHFLSDKDYTKVATQQASLMPAVHALPDEQRDLVAWLSTLGGAGGTILGPVPQPAESEFEALLHPKPSDWPTYYGPQPGIGSRWPIRP